MGINEIWGKKTNINKIIENLRDNEIWGNKFNINKILKNE